MSTVGVAGTVGADTYGAAVAADLRPIDPLRAVQVQLDDGRWVAGSQYACVRQPDGSWRASVEYVLQHDHGRGAHLASLPAGRVRLPQP